MPVAIPIIVAIVADTFIAYAAAAIAVVGAITGSKELSMIGGLVGLAGGFASVAGGVADAASGVADTAGSFADGISQGAEAAAGAGAGAAASPAFEAASTASDFADGIAQGALSGADPTQLSTATSSVADPGGLTVDPSNGYGQGGSGIEPASGGGSAEPGIPGADVADTPAAVAAQATAQEQAQNLINGPAPSTPTNMLEPVGVGTDYGGDTVLGAPGEGGLAGSGQQTWFDRIMGSKFLSGDATKSALVKAGGEFISKGFSRNTAGETVDLARKTQGAQIGLQRQRLDAEMAELARRNANSNNITAVSVGMTPNPDANIYPNGQYQPVKVAQRGIINRFRAA